MKANILNEHDANMMIWERSTVQYMSNILPHALHKGHLAVAHEIAGGYLFNDQSHGHLPHNKKKSHGYLEFIFLLLRQWVAEKTLEQVSTYVNCFTKLLFFSKRETHKINWMTYSVREYNKQKWDGLDMPNFQIWQFWGVKEFVWMD